MAYLKWKRLAKSFRRDSRGNVAMMFALVLSAVLVIVGIAYDSTLRVNSSQKAQDVADRYALIAAVYVKDNGKPPLNKNKGYIGKYSGADLNENFSDLNVDGAEGITVNIEYDEVAERAKVTVSGYAKAIFPGVSGKNSHYFEATSYASFQRDNMKKPVSLAIVVDNSNSMQWDDRIDPDQSNDEFETTSRTPEAVQRGIALNQAVSALLDDLKALEDKAAETGTERIVRTGLYPFTSYFDEDDASRLSWGTYSNGVKTKLDSLTYRGSTNSASAMVEVDQDMTTENLAHKNENGESDPLKYTILMSDGANNRTGSTNCRMEPMPAHKHYVYSYYRTSARGYLYKVVQHGRFPPEVNYIDSWPDGELVEDWAEHYIADGEEEHQVCDFIRGNDTDTLTTCKNLAADGGKVFTIGFGMEPGWYHRNNGDDPWASKRTAREFDGTITDKYHAYVSEEASERAKSMLRTCAAETGAQYFDANNAEELKAAFQAVGRTIISDYIRISG